MPLTGLSFEEIVKKEIAAGKTQEQAVAIAYSVTGKDRKNWTSNRVARGNDKYGSVKNAYVDSSELIARVPETCAECNKDIHIGNRAYEVSNSQGIKIFCSENCLNRHFGQ